MIELRDYQDRISTQGALLLDKYKICYLAMECRTGKTLTALAAALKHGARSVLVITKKKAIPSIYADYALMQPAFEMDVINYESCQKMEAGKYDLVILDEAHSIGAFPKPSGRARNVRTLCKGKPVIYLSGTPSPESYSQIYHQFWVSSYSPFRMFTNFYKWAKVYVDVKEKMRNGHMVKDYSDADKGRIDAATRKFFIDYTQQEAGFDSRIVEEVLVAPMSQWTADALDRLRRDRIIRWNDTVVLGDTPAKLMSKMHQLSSGSVISEQGEHVITDYGKAKFIHERFKGKKIAIFYTFQTELELLARAFPNWTCVPEEFQQHDGTDLVFMAQVRSAREGVRLDTADALIFYNLEFSYLSYEQGRNRLCSKERTEPARIYFIVSDCGIERDILEAVHAKEDFTAAYYFRRRPAF